MSTSEPLICAADIVTLPSAVTSKLSESSTKVFVFISTSEPLINAADADICPVDFNLKLLLDDLISSVDTSKPAIDAETKLANPSADIEALGVGAADGVLMLSAVMLPCTVNVLPSNCKKLPPAWSPSNIEEPVTLPSCLTLKLDVDINIYLGSSTPPCNGLPLIKIC